MLACSDGAPLILGSGDPHRVPPPEGRQSGQATWPWSHAAQMQTSPSQRTQRKRRASRSITGPRTGDVSGHGRGDERWSTSERRLDHRDDPEGSGRLPRAFALSAGPWATRTRQPLQESRQRPPSARLTHAAPGCHPSHPASSNGSAASSTEGSGLRPDRVTSLDHRAAAIAPHRGNDLDLDERRSRERRPPPDPSGQRGPVPGDLADSGTL
jgi:hypothetical protein